MVMVRDTIDEASATGEQGWHPHDLWIQAYAAYQAGEVDITVDAEIALDKHFNQCKDYCPPRLSKARRIHQVGAGIDLKKLLAGKSTDLGTS